MNLRTFLSLAFLSLVFVAATAAVPAPAQPAGEPRAKNEPSALPQIMTKPPTRPEEEKAEDEPDDTPEARPPAPSAGALIPPPEMQCRDELRKLGVAFETLPAIAAEGGCGTPFPLSVTGLGGGVDLEPEAVLNCRTALAAARFVKNQVAPQARARLGRRLTGIRHASAYVCRPRHDGSKLSEHAKANAIDFASFVLDDGEAVAVQAYGPGKQAQRRFMRRIRGAACGPFKTVLGPGSDADHADHLHLDMAERRNGGTWCR